MLNIGMGEMVVILIAALLVMGPDRLPEFARTLGKFIREFRRQTDDVRGVVMREIYKLETEADVEGTRTLAPPRPTAQTIAPPAAVALSVVDGLASAAQPPEPAQIPAGSVPAEPAPSPGTSPATEAGPAAPAANVLAAGPGPFATAPGEGTQGAATAATGAAPPAPPAAEAKVTFVDGIRIAPATGTVARGGARSGATATPQTSNATSSAADLPPSPPTSQS